MHVYMKTLYELMGDVLHGKPSEAVDRLTPWIIWVLGLGMVGVMVYGWWAGEW